MMSEFQFVWSNRSFDKMFEIIGISEETSMQFNREIFRDFTIEVKTGITKADLKCWSLL